MVGINYSEIKEKKRIAMIFSMICPGMGLIFYEKWVLGALHAVLHVVFGLLFLNGLVRNIVYQLDGIILFVLLGALIINWLVSLISTTTYKSDG